MGLIENDDMVEQFVPKTSNPSFGNSVLPWVESELLAHLGSAAAALIASASTGESPPDAIRPPSPVLQITRTSDHRSHICRIVVQKKRSRRFSEGLGRLRLITASLAAIRVFFCCRVNNSETLHWLGISPCRYRDIMFGVAHIDPCRIPVQCREPFIPLSFCLCLRYFRHLESSSILKWDETRPGCSRFENVSNGVEPADCSATCHQITDRHHRNHG